MASSCGCGLSNATKATNTMRERRTYRVELTVTKLITYEVEAISPEDAENIAEDFLADGEEPLASEIVDEVVNEIYPVESEIPN